jgi:hypothetical protein
MAKTFFSTAPDPRFAVDFVWVEGVFVTIHDDGEIEFSGDPDFVISRESLQRLLFRVNNFIEMRRGK